MCVFLFHSVCRRILQPHVAALSPRKKQGDSFLVHDSGDGLLSVKLAKLKPHAFVVSLESSKTSVDKHLALIDHMKLKNNFLCSPNISADAFKSMDGASSQELAGFELRKYSSVVDFLYHSPYIFDGQFIGQIFKEAPEMLSYNENSLSQLELSVGRLLSVAKTSFVILPSFERLFFGLQILGTRRFSWADFVKPPLADAFDTESLFLEACAKRAGASRVTITKLGDVGSRPFPSKLYKVDVLKLSRVIDQSYYPSFILEQKESWQPLYLQCDLPEAVNFFWNGHRLSSTSTVSLTLHALLELGLVPSQRSELFSKYFELALLKEMKPWNIVVNSDGSLGHRMFMPWPDNVARPDPKELLFMKAATNVAQVILNDMHTTSPSFVEYGSKDGAVSIDIARQLPTASVISIEPNALDARLHYKSIAKAGIENNLICRYKISYSLIHKLYRSPEFFQYQLINNVMDTFSRYTHAADFESFISEALAVAQVTYFSFPSSRLLALAASAFYPHLSPDAAGAPKSRFLTSSYPDTASVFHGYEAKIVSAFTKLSGLKKVGVEVVSDSLDLGKSSLVRIRTLNLTRTVHHHFEHELDGHTRKYTLHYANSEAHLVRAEDKSKIIYDRFGISLISLLRMGLHPQQKMKLYERFIHLPLYEDMAPWNLLFTEGKLHYVDKDTMDSTFDHVLPHGYQILLALMNFKRTVEDFGKCKSKGEVLYNFPYLADCTGSSSRRCFKTPDTPVACADGSCRSSFVECLRAIQQLEREMEEDSSQQAEVARAEQNRPLVIMEKAMS